MTDLASLVIAVDSTAVPKGVAALDSLTASGAKAEKQTGQIVVAQRRAVTAHDEATKAVSRNQYSMRNLGQQFGDFGQQALSGAGVLRAFTQQIGQMSYAMTEFDKGPLKSVGTFLAGPWGIALTLAATAAATFAESILNVGDAAEETEKRLYNLTTAAGIASQATRVNALIEQRGKLLEQLDGLPGQRGGVKTDLEYKIDREVGALDREINAMSRVIGVANTRLQAQQRQDEQNKKTTASTDKATASIQRHAVAVKSVVDEYAALYARGEDAMIALRNMSAVVTAEDVVKRGRDELADKIEGEKAVADFRKGAYESQDADHRERLLDTAYDFADIIGGGFGRAIADMISLLDRAEAVFRSGSGIEKAIAGAGIGGAAASATGGSGLGGSIGGAIGQKLGEKFGEKVLGKALGEFGGPIGAIAGGILGGVVGGLLKKTKKASATIEIMAGEAVQSSLTGNSAKLKATASAMADSLIGGLSKIADELGGMLGNGIRVSIGQRNKTFRVDLSGMGRTKGMPSFATEEEAVAYAIQQVIQQGAIVGLRAGTETLLKGQGDLEAQLQKALTFENVFREIEKTANPAKAAIDDIAKTFTDLIDIFGEANATADEYAKLQELMAKKQREAIEQAFEPIRTMLDDLKSKADTAGEAVKTAFQTVLSNETDAINAYNEAITAQQEAARQSALASMRNTISGLTDRIREFADQAARLREFSAGIFSNSGRPFSAAGVAAAAQAGDIGALQGYAESARNNAASRIDRIRQLALIKAEVDKAAGVAEGRAGGLRSQAEAMQAQLDAMETTADASVDMATLLKNMQTAKAAADLAREQMAKLGELAETEKSFAETVAAYEEAKTKRDDLIRDITAAGFAGMIEAQQQTAAQLIAAVSAANAAAQAAANAAAATIGANQTAAAAARVANDNAPWEQYINGIPMFASGGMHRGGVRLVGERGVEVEATGPARIWNAQQIGSAMGGEMAAEVRALREEVVRMRTEMKANLEPIAFNTGQTARDIRGTIKSGVMTVRTDSDDPLVTVAA